MIATELDIPHLLSNLKNIITHAFGLAADFWGIADGALTVLKMAPEINTAYGLRLTDVSNPILLFGFAI
jgi:hypothetical protein